MPKKTLTAGQKDYEAKRAAKAGMSLDKWLTSKEKEAEAEARAKQKAAEPPKPAKPPGILKRLIDRAHQPLKPEPQKSGTSKSGASPKTETAKARTTRLPPQRAR
jgi:hypothetical protein